MQDIGNFFNDSESVKDNMLETHTHLEKKYTILPRPKKKDAHPVLKDMKRRQVLFTLLYEFSTKK